MKVKKKINVARVVWVACLFLLLIVILLMVMDYKINYEYLSNNYLYFYKCETDVCASSIKDNTKELYATLDCGYQKCPEYKKKISDDYVLLASNSSNILYNLKKEVIISDMYETYEMLDNKYIVVTKDNLHGIIDTTNKVIVKPVYDEIGIHINEYLTGYNGNAIIAMKNEKYGLISYKTGKLVEEFKYTSEDIEELQNILKKD